MEDGGQSPATYLPDDLLVEILSRLPAKSLCRFKCVSRSWHALITDPAHRRRFAQTLSGIFFRRCYARTWRWGFTAFTTPPPHAWGNGDSPVASSALPFLPSACEDIDLLDSCNGLLLLRCSPSQTHGATRSTPPPPPPPAFYVVCNPAAGEWVALPQPSLEPGYDGFSQECGMIRTCSAALSFEPSVSSHFHVFQLVEEEDQTVHKVKAVEIYSSETGAWVLRECGWERWTCVFGDSIYFNGFQHFTTLYCDSVAMVDDRGQAWRKIQFPISSEKGFLGHSQGCLLYVDSVEQDDALAVYTLEDHDGDEWTFKHRISKLAMFGQSDLRCPPIYCVAMFHPDCDWILFYDRKRGNMMSYDMNKGDVHVICSLRQVRGRWRSFLPYVPMYSRTLASLPVVVD